MMTPSTSATGTTLPDDILIAIFTILSRRFDVFDRDSSMLPVSLVCRRWHCILNSTPTVWSNLHFSLWKLITHIGGTVSPGWPKRRLTQAIDMVERVLRRSGSCGLSILLDMPGTQPDLLAPHSRLVFSAIYRESYRWNSVTLVSPRMNSILDCLDDWRTQSTGVESLKHLTLRSTSTLEWNHTENVQFPSTLLSASLESITLNESNRAMLPRKYSLQWHFLLTYRGALYDPDHLKFGQNLRTYEARFTDRTVNHHNNIHDTSDTWALVPTSHTKLEELVIDNAAVFQDYVFPNLRRLSYYVRARPDGLAAMERMLNLAQPPLSHLYVALDDTGAEVIDDLLGALPSCVSRLSSLGFRLRGNGGIRALVPILTRLADNAYLPALREVRLWVASNHLDSDRSEEWQKLLADVAEARADGFRIFDMTFVPENKHKKVIVKELTTSKLGADVVARIKKTGARMRITVTAGGKKTRLL